MAHVGAAPAFAEQQDDDATPTMLTAKGKVAASLRAVGADPSTFLVPNRMRTSGSGVSCLFFILVCAAWGVRGRNATPVDPAWG